jgi:hypothetical protein
LILKLSVLASGVVLLDGEPVEMDALDRRLSAADKQSTGVWYYREAAGKEAPAQAMAVIQLVAKHKLRISMSSKPDFSDYIDSKGASHLRVGPPVVRMPEVLIPANIEEIFAKIREISCGEKHEGGLVILRPNRSYLVVPCMPDNPGLKKFASGLSHLLPSGVQRNVAVISNNEFSDQTPSVTDVDKAIPFFGLLMALSYLGHAVWIFEGHASALEAGCREADALIVDSALIPVLAGEWQEKVRAVMRSPNILVHDRATFQLRVVSKLGTAKDRLEFNT